MDISAIFKVVETDTCLFVRISCTLLYSNGVLSIVEPINTTWNWYRIVGCYSLTYRQITWKETRKKIYKGKQRSLMKKTFVLGVKSIWMLIESACHLVQYCCRPECWLRKLTWTCENRIPTEKGTQFEVQKLKENRKTALANLTKKMNLTKHFGMNLGQIWRNSTWSCCQSWCVPVALLFPYFAKNSLRQGWHTLWITQHLIEWKLP